MASTSNQIDSSFTPRWNVFLSFMGEDTRGNFTGHLYKALDRVGIQTFMDDPELPRGEKISPALLKAIQESEISIVVISKNYASSTWCLDELTKILECRKTMGQLVLPVFYKVKPSDVRYQRGSFAEAFEKHKNRYMDKVLEKWRATLTETAHLAGYHLDANGNEPDLIEQIVDKVNDEVNPRYLNVAKKPVGIASHVNNITPLLSIGTNGVRKIGIYGMGGVGKTTVAKAMYNENFHSFQGSCFLTNVREISGQLNGIVRLQEQLVSEVLKSKIFTITNVDNGISLIQEKLRFKRLLIVLDDLDHLNQLDSLAGQWNRFASGSIIMITTRDARLLDQIQVDGRYKVEELNNNDSLELFSLHAFGKTIPSKDFMEVSQEIIGYASGLPLALEVFGSNLSNQTMLAWRRFIKKLQQVPNHEIHEKLMISFDTLADVDLKDIFLDIACFFIGKEREEATTILSACYDFVENDISILEKRCLLKINKKNELRMHDLLRDMGREIVRNKSPKEVEKHSRLWCSIDICNVLNKDKGTESIEGIVPYDGILRLLVFGEFRWPCWSKKCSLECLPSDFHPEKQVILDLRSGNLGTESCDGELDQVTLNTKTFERMHRLRLVDISGVHLTGSFAHIFEELRWLCWCGCSLECLPSDFHPEKLVILDLRYSNLNMLCNGNLFLEQLKILDLRYCKFLKTTADISGLASLEKLLLRGCTCLVEVHPSIECLGKLVCLDLSYCTNLTILTSRVCNLRALEYLYVNYCSNLEGLPEELGNMESIRVLKAGTSPINKLPDSIGLLRNLHELNLNECKNLVSLPSSIGQLRGLEILILDYCFNLESLPEELGKMECLTKLSAQSLSIKNLPDSIGQLSKLVELELSNCGNLRFLPDNICNLRALRDLYLNGCSNLERLPEELGKMECLTKLSAWNLSIKNLPNSIGQLSKLVELELRECGNLRCLPDNICNLRALRDLNLGSCFNLESLPEELGSIESLEFLSASRTLIVKLPDSIGLLRNLLKLYLNECRNLINLPSSIGQLRGLECLILDGCSNLQSLPDSIGLLRNLLKLDLNDCRNLINLPSSIGQLRGLECLILGGCSNLESLPEELGKMECLTKLKAWGLSIKNLPDSIGQLSKLVKLDLRECGNLRFLPDNICNLRALKRLKLGGCSNLEWLPQELGKMEGLRELHGGSINLKKIPDSIGDMKNLRELHLPGRLDMNLDLVLHSPFTRFVPPSITGLCSLNSLDLNNCYLFDEDIPDNIGSLSSLKSLDLSDNFFSSLPSSLIQLSNLRMFYLRRCKRLRSLPGIPPNLCKLFASECTSLERLPNLSNLEELVRLELTNCSRLVEIQGLENLKSLTHVGIEGCDNLESTFRESYRD